MKAGDFCRICDRKRITDIFCGGLLVYEENTGEQKWTGQI